MSCTIDDQTTRTRRSRFRAPQPESTTATTTVPTALPDLWPALRSALFRTLIKFPDAYHAVVAAVRELDPELVA